MVQATLDLSWVPKEKCPLKAVITKVEEVKETIKGRPYTSYRLTLESKGSFYSYDAKFGDKNFLVNTISPETDNWTGKTICVAIDEATGYKRIEANYD